MRRLRSAFTLFRPIVGDQEFLTLREEVRWFTNQLGDARNLDVILKRIPSAKDANSSQAELRRTLEAARERAYAAVLDALASPRLRRLMLDLVGWTEVGTWRGAELAQRPIGEFGRAQLDRRWRKVKKGGKNLATLEVEALHRLRIEVKKLRYAVEFFAALEMRKAALALQGEFSAALEDMQEHLGELNDVETAHGLLESLLSGQPHAEEMIRTAGRFIDRGAQKVDPVSAAGEAYNRLREAGPFWR
jgi:CHAD domain-containing protein